MCIIEFRLRIKIGLASLLLRGLDELSFGDSKISKKLLKQYTKPFADKTQRNGVFAFAKSLLNDQDWFEQLWSKQQIISDKPALFVWGNERSCD